jgi:hypothetical protein
LDFGVVDTDANGYRKRLTVMAERFGEYLSAMAKSVDQ